MPKIGVMEERAKKPQMLVFTYLAVIWDIPFDDPFWHSNYQPRSRRKDFIMPSISGRHSFAIAVLAFLAGVLALQQFAELPTSGWALFTFPVFALAFVFRPMRLPACAAAGFLLAWWTAAAILAQALPTELEGEDLVAEGIIASLPDADTNRTRFELKIERLLDGERPVDGLERVQLSWYGAQRPMLRAGERWRFTVRLKRPHGFMNPGGFDYEAWLFRHGLRATGYVRADEEYRRLPVADHEHPLLRARQTLADTMSNALADRPYAGIVEALAYGESSRIPPPQWEVLAATGTTHLVAISGSHITLIAGLAYFLMRRAWLRVPRLALRWPAPKAAAVAAMLAALIYSALAGFAVPTQRALIMVGVVMFAVLRQRHTRPFHVLAIALLLVLLWDPLAVMEAGFWLSFAAVAVIFYGMTARLAPRGWWWYFGRAQLLVAIGLLPLTLILFQRVSLVSPLANLIAVPWVTWVVVPITLVGACLSLWSTAAGALVLGLADLTMAALWPLLAWLTESGIALWTQPAPPAWTLIPAAIGALVLLAPAGMPGRWVGAVLLLPLVVVSPARPPAGEAWLTLLDVGQGLSAVVRTRSHSLLFDTGPGFSESFDAGGAAVVPFLRASGIQRIDTLIVSHGDKDHIGGLSSVVKQVPVDKVLTSVPDKVAEFSPGAQVCRAGQRWEWDGVDFEIIYPIPELGTRGNDASCVLRVSTVGTAALLPGDIEKRSEKVLLAEKAPALRADVLVAPHHGSNTSSSAPFLDAVRPEYALFAVGYRNRYGFPKPAVVERYRAAEAAMLSSAHEGAITLRLTAAGVASPPESYRRAALRYWHAR